MAALGCAGIATRDPGGACKALTVLRGAVELLQSRWDRLSDDERKQWFDMTSRSADVLSADIDGLLAAAVADVRR